MPCKNGSFFIDELARYAALYSQDSADSGASLFGEMEEMKPVRPDIPENVEIDDEMEILQKEKEYVGMYISSHPLEKYSFEMETFTNQELATLGNVIAECEASKKKMKIAVAGLVTETSTLTTKTGKPYSRTKLEDYSGSYELSLFGRDYETFMKYLQPHASLYIEGEIDEKYSIRPEERAQGKVAPFGFRIKGISLLGNVNETKLAGFSISITTPMPQGPGQASQHQQGQDSPEDVPLRSGHEVQHRIPLDQVPGSCHFRLRLIPETHGSQVRPGTEIKKTG